jgi:anthranilate phosphoribosyltransferase
VKQIATLRVTQAAAKVGENAPLAVCCNACRTCVTTNIVGLATALLAGSGLAVAKFGKRLLGRKTPAV